MAMRWEIVVLNIAGLLYVFDSLPFRFINQEPEWKKILKRWIIWIFVFYIIALEILDMIGTQSWMIWVLVAYTLYGSVRLLYMETVGWFFCYVSIIACASLVHTGCLNYIPGCTTNISNIIVYVLIFLFILFRQIITPEPKKE